MIVVLALLACTQTEPQMPDFEGCTVHEASTVEDPAALMPSADSVAATMPQTVDLQAHIVSTQTLPTRWRTLQLAVVRDSTAAVFQMLRSGHQGRCVDAVRVPLTGTISLADGTALVHVNGHVEAVPGGVDVLDFQLAGQYEDDQVNNIDPTDAYAAMQELASVVLPEIRPELTLGHRILWARWVLAGTGDGGEVALSVEYRTEDQSGWYLGPLLLAEWR